MAKKSTGSCDCVRKVNKQLEDRECAVTQRMQVDFETGTLSMSAPLVQVHKTGKSRKSLPTIVCTFCPFCGKKIQ